MNARRLLAVAYKEWREILRDRIFFVLAFILPIVLMLVFGYGATQEIENIPLAIIDYDHSVMSRDYARHFINSRYFDFKGYLGDPQQADRLLADGKVRVLLVIPNQFQLDLMEGRDTAVQTLLDGTFTLTVRTIQGYINAINNAVNSELQAVYLTRRLSIALERALLMLRPIRLEVRYLYNQEVRILWDIAPALIMFILLLTAPLLTALSVVREKETGAIYNINASTISRSEYLAGKLVPNVLVSFVNAIILWLLATFYFGAPFKGSLLFFLASTIAYILSISSIGLLISLLVRTQQAALMITVVISFIIGIQFSGMVTPIAALDGPNYVMAHSFPAMYYNRIIQGTFLKGLGTRDLWPDLTVLVGYSASLLTVCYLLFHKRTRT